MNIGAKVYYDISTGDILVNTGERSGDVKVTTIEEDFEIYDELTNKNPELIGVLQLEYGIDFFDRNEGGYFNKIDLETLKPFYLKI